MTRQRRNGSPRHNESPFENAVEMLHNACARASLLGRAAWLLFLCTIDAILLHTLRSLISNGIYPVLLASVAPSILLGGLIAPFLSKRMWPRVFLLTAVLNLGSCCSVLGFDRAVGQGAGASTSTTYMLIMLCFWHSLVVAIVLPLALSVSLGVRDRVLAIWRRLFPRVPRVRLVRELGEAALGDSVCVVCLEPATTSDSPYADGQRCCCKLGCWTGAEFVGKGLIVLPCKHAFHAKCIESWLSDGKDTCPTCRKPSGDARVHHRILLRTAPEGEEMFNV